MSDLAERIKRVNEIEEEFFTKAFTDPVTKLPYNVPEDIKRLAIRLCKSYGIHGMCDPMYIANIIALELGLGDGKNHFFENRFLRH